MNALLEALSRTIAEFKVWITVAPWEAGVRVRFGKTAVLLGPGIHWRIPLLDRIHIESVRRRTISDVNLTFLTRDKKTVTLTAAVQYSVADLVQLYMTLAQPDTTMLNELATVLLGAVEHTFAVDLCKADLETAATAELQRFTKNGLRDISVSLIAITTVRPLRVMMNDYRNTGSLNGL